MHVWVFLRHARTAFGFSLHVRSIRFIIKQMSYSNGRACVYVLELRSSPEQSKQLNVKVIETCAKSATEQTILNTQLFLLKILL